MTSVRKFAKNGEKFGKTAEGAVWLDTNRTSPFAFWQFWLDQDDHAVPQLLRQLTLESDELTTERLAVHAANPSLRNAQRHLAKTMTTLVHGSEVENQAATVAAARGTSSPTPSEIGRQRAELRWRSGDRWRRTGRSAAGSTRTTRAARSGSAAAGSAAGTFSNRNRAPA